MKRKLSYGVLIIVIGILSTMYVNPIHANTTRIGPPDWAFDTSSKELNDAIISKYSYIDSDSDGFISVSEAQGMYNNIELRYAGIQGTLNGLEHFINVPQIDLRNNEFTGEIPRNIGNISSLTLLNLQSNQLTGTIPQSIENLTNMQILLLSDNNLVGDVPTGIWNMAQLNELSLQTNQLTGNLPTSVSGVPSLNHLALGNNQFTGVIPSDLDTLVNLSLLSLYNNKITGPIPQNLGTTSNLSYVFLSNNELSGPVPAGFATTGALYIGLDNNPGLTGDTEIMFDVPYAPGYIRVEGTSMSQKRPASSYVYAFSFDVLNKEKNDLRVGVTQEDINNLNNDLAMFHAFAYDNEAQSDIDDRKNLTVLPSMNYANTAQSIVNAKELTSGLFHPDGTLKDTVDNNTIAGVQISIDQIPNGNLKDSLQNDVNKATKIVDAKQKVDDLYLGDQIKETTTYTDIGTAQSAVDLLEDTALKTELETKVANAKYQLDQRSFVIAKDFAKFDGSGTRSIEITAPMNELTNLSIDGTIVPSSNYTVSTPSTTITLNENYLKTLSESSHTVVISYQSGVSLNTQLIVELKKEITETLPSIPPVEKDEPVTYNLTASGSSVGVISVVNTGQPILLELIVGIILTIIGVSFVCIVKVKKTKNS